MSVACVYHRDQDFRVVTFDERDKLLATGEWFNTPKEAHNNEECNDERQIRRRKRKGRGINELAPEPLGS